MTERWICSSAPRVPSDPCVPLLFESAKPYYTAYAGSEQRALALLRRGVHATRPRRELRAAAASPTPTRELVGVRRRLPRRRAATGSRAASSG